MPSNRNLRGSASKETKSTEAKKTLVSKVFVKNRTKQKQVLQLDNEQLVLDAYGKKEVALDFETANEKFAYWINKNIVELTKK